MTSRSQQAGAKLRRFVVLKRWFLRLTALACLLAVALAGWTYLRLRSSLPQLQGEAALPGLAAEVEVLRDSLGVPVIRALSRVDASRATGFLHAQDRFFQMDLFRRSAAGEMAELLGGALASSDEWIRIHRFRKLAQRAFRNADEQERAMLQAYAEGVNSGLEALGGPPFEYVILFADPEPWLPEDSYLVVYAMYLDLQYPRGERESAMGLLYEALPGEMADFLAPVGTSWDAPVHDLPLELPPVPEAAAFDLRRGQAQPSASDGPDREAGHERSARGSNAWAVAGWRSSHGGALLANDMHMGLRVPNLWYRAGFRYQEGGTERRVDGVTLPGSPAMVSGSNGRIAWGFSNCFADWSDLVVLEPAQGVPDSYRTAQGPRRFEIVEETIRVRGGDDRKLQVASTIWGPVVDRDHRGRQRAYRWVAHDPDAADFRIMGLERAESVDDALALAARCGVPGQNLVVADSQGNVGWTIIGPIPERFGHDGMLPRSWADDSLGWKARLAPEDYPRIVQPEDGLIWTANARVVSGEMLDRLGHRGWALGARATQIRDSLRLLEKADEKDMLAIQLDDRALSFERWRRLLLDVLTPEAVRGDKRRAELRRILEGGNGRASIDSVDFRMIRSIHGDLADQVMAALTAACREVDPDFDFWRLGRGYEYSLWQLATRRPPHLLAPRFESWEEQILAAVDATLDYFIPDGGSLSEATWGKANIASIRHPLSAFLPLPGVSGVLDMPSDALPGGGDVPRVQSPDFGAAQRMTVSPGKEEEGIFHMPGGQSGHPFSPHYRDSHSAWVRGEATPFLPGDPINRLLLKPQPSQ